MEITLNIINRDIFLSKEITPESVEEIIKKIIEINDYDEHTIKYGDLYSFKYIIKPIRIFIDSYGGSAYQCFGLISVIKSSKTPIHTICTGNAMSAAFMILIHGHKRFCYEHSTIMYHQMSSFSMGTLKNIEEDVNECKRIQKIIEKMVLCKTKISKKKIKEIYAKKNDWFITSKEAKHFNIVDEVL